uniref:(northern house mosquito) hypothetical protein n=1 Tax=Culex pipiens TaxID=7175 RepID=A0A8D8DTF4_CULPI
MVGFTTALLTMTKAVRDDRIAIIPPSPNLSSAEPSMSSKYGVTGGCTISTSLRPSTSAASFIRIRMRSLTSSGWLKLTISTWNANARRFFINSSGGRNSVDGMTNSLP